MKNVTRISSPRGLAVMPWEIHKYSLRSDIVGKTSFGLAIKCDSVIVTLTVITQSVNMIVFVS